MFESDKTKSAGSPTATFYAIWAELEGDTNGDYWQLCSDGRVGYADTAPVSGGCRLNWVI